MGGVVVTGSRLIVQLTSAATADLDWLTARDEVNKTTAVNRALRIARALLEEQENGGGMVTADGLRVRVV